MSMGGAAFGAPGVSPTWCSSDKDFVTTGLGSARLWATVGHGIINEVYWPSTGEPQLRDFGFYLVGANAWIDLKRVRRYRLSTPQPYVPLLTITHYGDDYELALEVLPDPIRDVLLIGYRLTGPYQVVMLLAPHLGSSGRDNNAWIDGQNAYAARGEYALCLASDQPLSNLSTGFVGASDGWQDLARHGRLSYDFGSASGGTVALTAQLASPQGAIALAFCDTPLGAHTRARSALAEGMERIRVGFMVRWSTWGGSLQLPAPTASLHREALLSAAVMKIHEDRAYPGAVVASLSVPWGNSSDSLGGYHLVWPRDAALTAFALLAAKQNGDACRMLAHLIAVQRPEGRWPQNYFPNGMPFWGGEQLDETAFPVLLAAKLREIGVRELPGTQAMVRRAVGYVARMGPGSEQDRWEENPGISAFTLAVAISALVAAVPWLSPDESAYALDLANEWNERLESWCYVMDTPLARDLGVRGYYVRIGSPDKCGDTNASVTLRNRNGETILASALVSLDFSYLVRLGLRDARDPRVRDTIAVVDRVLRVETPSGALYHRYNEDGYGEYADGRPFDGSGIGRAWPLLVGERGHLALQAGEDPLPYLQTMERCASDGGLLPEQVWDAPAIPELELAPGKPSGSAMPLLWAHAEFLKLLVARETKRPIEMLESVRQHFGTAADAAAGTGIGTNSDAPVPPAPPAEAWRWSDRASVSSQAPGRALLIVDAKPFFVHYGWDGWLSVEERTALALPFGLWGVRFEAAELAAAAQLNFTRRYGEHWEGVDHCVRLGGAVPVPALASA